MKGYRREDRQRDNRCKSIKTDDLQIFYRWLINGLQMVNEKPTDGLETTYGWLTYGLQMANERLTDDQWKAYR